MTTDEKRKLTYHKHATRSPRKKHAYITCYECGRKSIHVIFDETNAAPRKGVIANDDADFEDHIIEEPKEKD